ncbi:MAG TPA: sterol desaturase family protein [Herpetosiphonaceae bacterium]
MNLDALLALYREPMFWIFPVGTVLLSTAAFALFAAPFTWIAWKRPRWAEPYRIQERSGQGDRIIGPSIRYFTLNGLVLLGSLVLTWPVLRLSGVHAGPLPPWYVMLAQVLLFIYLDDFLFYWMHRALHTRVLYKRIHATHHRFNVPWAIAGNYMHPIEFLAIASLVLVGPVLVSAHVMTIWIWVIFRQWEAVEGHCGYDFPWNPLRWLPFHEGAAFHDFHHSTFRGNYAGFTSLWDGVFGTLSPGYEAHMAAQRADPQEPPLPQP